MNHQRDYDNFYTWHDGYESPVCTCGQIWDKHTHECRRCHAEIACEGCGEGCWDGDNAGCDCETVS